MRVDVLFAAALAATSASAYPGMGRGLFKEIGSRSEGLGKRSVLLLGDLMYLSDHELSEVGRNVKSILQGHASATVTGHTSLPPPGGKSAPQCKQDTCCIWTHIASDMVPVFTDGNGCSALARGAIRLGFHDAGAWNSSLASGGADGSILLAPDELPRRENSGLQDIATQTKQWFAKYQGDGISMADLIQFGAMVATVTCPLGPRMRFLVGREDSNQAPPEGLLPSPFADAPSLISLFEAKTFTAADLVALVGAHTVSQQFFTNTTVAGAAQDTTDGVWDTAFYSQTLSSQTPKGVYKFPSDVALSKYSGTAGTWQAFSGRNGQGPWDGAYSQAYFRMSLLGVPNINQLTDCSSALPQPR